MSLVTVNIQPQPAPVMPSSVSIEYRYLVVRGDGHHRILPDLYGTRPLPPWEGPGYFSVDTTKVILIPVDLLTALRLKLIEPDEIELPEAARALINMIK